MKEVRSHLTRVLKPMANRDVIRTNCQARRRRPSALESRGRTSFTSVSSHGRAWHLIAPTPRAGNRSNTKRDAGWTCSETR
jgi:hypothetical protein